MLATLLLVFREVLEAALIVSIVAAATRGVPRRGAWIGSGIALGVLGAGLVALFANGIADAMEGMADASAAAWVASAADSCASAAALSACCLLVQAVVESARPRARASRVLFRDMVRFLMGVGGLLQ